MWLAGPADRIDDFVGQGNRLFEIVGDEQDRAFDLGDAIDGARHRDGAGR